MVGRTGKAAEWRRGSANDNEVRGAAAAEGVMQCLHFLAEEAERLGLVSACNILMAAVALRQELDATAAHALPDTAAPVLGAAIPL